MKFQRDHIRKLSTTLAARERLIADDSEKITRQRNAARQLERDDDATASWADQPVPDATRRWLQQLAADAAAGGDNAGAAELPAEAAAGADEDDQQQP
jgi:hypothetical protein